MSHYWSLPRRGRQQDRPGHCSVFLLGETHDGRSCQSVTPGDFLDGWKLAGFKILICFHCLIYISCHSEQSRANSPACPELLLIFPSEKEIRKIFNCELGLPWELAVSLTHVRVSDCLLSWPRYWLKFEEEEGTADWALWSAGWGEGRLPPGPLPPASFYLAGRLKRKLKIFLRY